MKILLAEDDLNQLEPLQTALLQENHIVDGVQDGDTAHWFLASKEYDLLILDWMLPQISGIQLCRLYRQMGKVAPVVMLTAKDGLYSKVEGLDAGADDYWVKPIDVVELLARVRAFGRRSSLWHGDSLRLADLTLHLTNMTLDYQGQTLQLSKKEFQLLEYFLRHPCQILTHDQIEQAIWTWDMEPESNAMSKLVRRLRQRLRTVGTADWLESIYGVGYRLKPVESALYLGVGC